MTCVTQPSGYLDAASAAPLHPAARRALEAALADGWADPGRIYGEGRRARLLLDASREAVAEGVGARPDELEFCAGGTVALHLGVLGTLAGNSRAGRRLVHSAVEHSAVLHAAESHVGTGGEAVAVPVDALGRVDPDRFVELARRQGVAAAALQAGNHEVGTLQPVGEMAEAIGAVPLVVDGYQTVGHVQVPAGWSVLCGDASGWGGPAGVGFVAIRTGTRWRSPGPIDDRGRIPGQPWLPAIVAAAAALRAVVAERDTESARQSALIDRIRRTVAETIPDVEVLGDPVERLPHIVTFSCLYVDGEAVVTALDRLGFAVSSGSSCAASTLEPSHVLVAMGARTSGNVRVSLSPETTDDAVDRFLAALPGVVADVRAELGAAGL